MNMYILYIRKEALRCLKGVLDPNSENKGEVSKLNN